MKRAALVFKCSLKNFLFEVFTLKKVRRQECQVSQTRACAGRDFETRDNNFRDATAVLYYYMYYY